MRFPRCRVRRAAPTVRVRSWFFGRVREQSDEHQFDDVRSRPENQPESGRSDKVVLGPNIGTSRRPSPYQSSVRNRIWKIAKLASLSFLVLVLVLLGSGLAYRGYRHYELAKATLIDP